MPIALNGDGSITGNTSIVGHLSVSAQPCCLLTHPVDENFTGADDDLPLERIISTLVSEIKLFISENRLNINEEKIGYCLIDVFENYKTIFIAGKGNKFNKNVILYQLREMSGLTTKEIRASLKPYKNIYKDILGSLVNQ